MTQGKGCQTGQGRSTQLYVCSVQVPKRSWEKSARNDASSCAELNYGLNWRRGRTLEIPLWPVPRLQFQNYQLKNKVDLMKKFETDNFLRNSALYIPLCLKFNIHIFIEWWFSWTFCSYCYFISILIPKNSIRFCTFNWMFNTGFVSGYKL